MMLRGFVSEGDFKKAIEILNEIYPDVVFNVKDLTSLNTLSFRKHIDEWDENDSPIKDRRTFHTYKNIGMTLMNI